MSQHVQIQEEQLSAAEKGSSQISKTTNPAEPEAVIRAARRRFTASYKLSILEEIDRTATSVDRGAIMRREGLYASRITEWRKARSKGALSALSQQRGRPVKSTPQDEQLALLKAENMRLQAKLSEAVAIIDIQKKVSEILGNKIQTTPENEWKS